MLPRVLQPKNPKHSAISLERALKNIHEVLLAFDLLGDRAANLEMQDRIAAAIDDTETMLENIDAG
jgi:hypothetical protein